MSRLACEEGFDPNEDRLRGAIRTTIEAVFNEELDGFLGRLRYGRARGAAKGTRHGTRDRQITGTFVSETVSVPRARVEDEDGRVREWRSKALPRDPRVTKAAEALITAVSLSGTNTRRVKRALFALLKGAVGKDVVSRARPQVEDRPGRLVSASPYLGGHRAHSSQRHCDQDPDRQTRHAHLSS